MRQYVITFRCGHVQFVPTRTTGLYPDYTNIHEVRGPADHRNFLLSDYHHEEGVYSGVLIWSDDHDWIETWDLDGPCVHES